MAWLCEISCHELDSCSIYRSRRMVRRRDGLHHLPAGAAHALASSFPAAQMVELLTWARAECLRRSIGIRELLRHIRDRIDAEVLASPDSIRHVAERHKES